VELSTTVTENVDYMKTAC